MPYIPDSIFKSGIWETLSGVETRVYVILCQHYNRAEKKAYPSVIRIAKMCGSSKSRVIKTVHSLCEKGLVIKKKKANPYGQDFNYYLLPDFLLYEYELLSKDPKKNIDTIMEITNILMKELGVSKRHQQVSERHRWVSKVTKWRCQIVTLTILLTILI